MSNKIFEIIQLRKNCKQPKMQKQLLSIPINDLLYKKKKQTESTVVLFYRSSKSGSGNELGTVYIGINVLKY